jgi:transcriptional regulator with XRE-family HTH domain
MTYNYQAALRSERNKNKVYEVVLDALSQHCEDTGMNRKDIASKIGKSQGLVSRWLSGPSNWTLETISDLLFAADSELEYRVVKDKDRTLQNFHNAVGEISVIPNFTIANNPTANTTTYVEAKAKMVTA